MSYQLGRDEMFWRLAHENTAKLILDINKLENVEFKDEKGYSYLHVAAGSWNVEAVQALLQKGANPNCLDNRGHSPIFRAIGRIHENNAAILRLFLEHGLELDRIEGDMTIRETIASFEDEELNEVIRSFENGEH